MFGSVLDKAPVRLHVEGRKVLETTGVVPATSAATKGFRSLASYFLCFGLCACSIKSQTSTTMLSSSRPLRMSTASKRGFSMLVEPRGQDSFKEIEEEIDGDALRKSVGKMKPGVAKVWKAPSYNS